MQPKLWALASLVALPALFASSPAGGGDGGPGDDREALARQLFERAEEKASKGHYEQARSDYREVVEKYPATEAGRRAAKRIEPNALLGWTYLVQSGDSANRVDLVILGDGYEIDELERSFHPAAKDVVEACEKDEVLREYFSYFNFVRAAVVSAESGADGYGREYDTALGGRVTDEKGPRFVEVDPSSVTRFLDQLPSHDGVAVALVDDEARGASSPGVATVGGAAHTIEEMIHSLGHGFALLGDELTDTNSHRFPFGARPNLSTAKDDVPWKHWLAAKHPVVGVYEGASGRAQGVFRPVGSNCLMNEAKEFCPVCREAVVLAIYRSVDPIDAQSPEPHALNSLDALVPELEPTSHTRLEKLAFEVVTQKPATHDLEVTWWVLPEHRAPRSGGTRLTHEERLVRGALPPIEAEPVHSQRTSKDGRYSLEVDPAKLSSGRHRVVCRAVDRTLLRGEKFPWVLEDEAALLESERAWWIRIP